MPPTTIEDLTTTERLVWEAFGRGEALDLGAGGVAQNDPDETRSCGSDRQVRGVVIAGLVCGDFGPEAAASAQVSLQGARILGGIDIRYQDLRYPLILVDCDIEGMVNLDEVSSKTIAFMNCMFPTLSFNRCRVSGMLELSGCRAGTFEFHSLYVAGRMSLERTELEQPLVMPSARIDGDLVLQEARMMHGVDATRVNVGGSILFERLTSEGPMTISGAQVDGYLLFGGARLSNPGGFAIVALGVKASGVQLHPDFESVGCVNFAGSTLDLAFIAVGAKIHNPGGLALVAIGARLARAELNNAEIQGSIFLNNVIAERFDMFDARVTDAMTGTAAINLDHAKVGGNLHIGRSHLNGTVRLCSTAIAGGVWLAGTELDPEPGEFALLATGASCRGLGMQNGFKATGSVALNRAEIAGDVLIRDASLNGGVAFHGTQIAGRLMLESVRLGNTNSDKPAAIAFFGDSMIVGEALTTSGECIVDGVMSFSHARIAMLSLPGTKAAAVLADHLQVGGEVRLGTAPDDALHVDGPMQLNYAEIGGDLQASGLSAKQVLVHSARIAGNAMFSDVSLAGISMFGARVTNLLLSGRCNGSVMLQQLVTRGGVELYGDFTGIEEAAVYAEEATFEGSAVFHGTYAGGVDLRRVRIGGNLDLHDSVISSRDNEAAVILAASSIGGRLRFMGAKISGSIDMAEVTLSGFADFSGAQIRHQADRTAVFARGAKSTSGILFGRGLEVTGSIDLRLADIAGEVWFDDAKILTNNTRSVDGFGLNADGVYLRKTHALGDVLLTEATLQKALHIVESSFPSLWARNLSVDSVELRRLLLTASADMGQASVMSSVSMSQVSIESDLAAKDIEVRGRLDLINTKVVGKVSLNGAVIGALNLEGLSEPTDIVDLSSVRSDELTLPGGPSVPIDLRGGRVGKLAAPVAGSSRLLLDGLVFEELVVDDNVQSRLGWLRRDSSGYRPQPYQQLAAYYDRMGDDEAARTVRLARLRHQRAKLQWGRVNEFPLKIWGFIQDGTVGYGYRPWLAVAWLVVLLVGGAWFFSVHPQPPAGDSAPTYSPWAYALDLLVPIVNLGHDTAWDPQGAGQWVHYGLVFAGWILVTAVVAAVTRKLQAR